MKLSYIILCCCLIFGNAERIYSQSLDSLIQEAYDNNIELQILEKQYQSRLQVVLQIAPRPDPELGIGLYPLPVETRLGTQLSRISAIQMLPQKGMVEAQKGLAAAKAQPIIEQINAQKLELAYQVKMAWLQVYELDKSRVVMQRNLQILESLENLALVKVETGKASPADVLMVQLQIQNLKNEILVLKKLREKPLADLKSILNRPALIDIEITDSLTFATLMYQKDSLLNIIKDHHPTLKLIELQQEVAKHTILVNTLKEKPTFGIGLDYMTVFSRQDADPIGNGRDIVQLRGTVKIPLYKDQYEAKRQEERLKIEALELQKQNTAEQYWAIIDKAYTDYETAQLRLDLYKQQIATTRTAIDFLKGAYSVNGQKFEELLRLEKAITDYDLMILKAIVNSHQAKVLIDKFLK